MPTRFAIRDKAADRDGRIVAIQQLVLFSTGAGDAWLLDVAGHLAVPLARDGEPESIYLEETNSSFAIEWRGDYRIEGSAFVYADPNRPRHDHPRLSDAEDLSSRRTSTLRQAAAAGHR